MTLEGLQARCMLGRTEETTKTQGVRQTISSAVTSVRDADCNCDKAP